MKKYLFLMMIIPLLSLSPLFSAEQAEIQQEDSVELNPKTKFPAIKEKPFIVFNEGVTVSQITRLIKQDKYNRSNFVWQNYLVGLYCEMQTENIKPVDSLLRIAVYYPFKHTFNGMDQKATQPILYAFDVYYGPFFQTDMWKYVYINFSFGPHFLYELSDEYHHIQLGGAVLLGLELPLLKRWTVINNGLFAVDYGNIGSNRVIAPYDFVWQYQLELGCRYSKRKQNKYTYIHKLDKKAASTEKVQDQQAENDGSLMPKTDQGTSEQTENASEKNPKPENDAVHSNDNLRKSENVEAPHPESSEPAIE
ncbi:hypothetical protein IZU27_02335 [Treponema socranskii]|uniref:hypothetical protein n=1 Tax=Treponema socranskii TaxID=53419 RepID=UPI003D8F98AE